jgi:hypothetical protein
MQNDPQDENSIKKLGVLCDFARDKKRKVCDLCERPKEFAKIFAFFEYMNSLAQM